MAPIIWPDVSSTFPSDPNIVNASGMAQQIVLSIVNGAGLDASNFGGEDADLTLSARVLYAAHIVTLMARRGNGAIASQSEGGASQSYWFGFANPRLLHLTGYGQTLSQLIMGTPARAGILL